MQSAGEGENGGCKKGHQAGKRPPRAGALREMGLCGNVNAH
jgi:hypothetical protein